MAAIRPCPSASASIRTSRRGAWRCMRAGCGRPMSAACPRAARSRMCVSCASRPRLRYLSVAMGRARHAALGRRARAGPAGRSGLCASGGVHRARRRFPVRGTGQQRGRRLQPGGGGRRAHRHAGIGAGRALQRLAAHGFPAESPARSGDNPPTSSQGVSSEKLSTEQLQATAEILRRVQERLARSGSLPLEPTLYACARDTAAAWRTTPGPGCPACSRRTRACRPGWTRTSRTGAPARRQRRWSMPAARTAGSRG